MFDLSQIPVPYKTFPPAKAAQIEQIECDLGVELSAEYRQFITESDGLYVEDYGQILTETASLVELNTSFHIQERMPGFIHIGMDGGGNGILLTPSGNIVMCEHGSLGLLTPTPVAASFSQWAAEGFRLPVRDSPEINRAAPADVSLVSMPTGGLRDVALIRSALSIEISLRESKTLIQTLPVVLPASLTYGQAVRRVEKLGTLASCLAVTVKDSDSRT